MTWDEAKHPRNPDDGRWVDNPSAALAQKIRDMGEQQVGRELVLAALHPKGPRLESVSQDINSVKVPNDPHSFDFGIISERGGRFYATSPHARIQGAVPASQARGDEEFASERAATLFLWQHGMTERGRRERYNADILGEAYGMQDSNAEEETWGEIDAQDQEEFGGPDEDLDAQIELVEKLRDGQVAPGGGTIILNGVEYDLRDPAAWDAAVDHLRGMLTMSYLDDSDLPEPPP